MLLSPILHRWHPAFSSGARGHAYHALWPAKSAICHRHHRSTSVRTVRTVSDLTKDVCFISSFILSFQYSLLAYI